MKALQNNKKSIKEEEDYQRGFIKMLAKTLE
jgi:hypothetical protein